MDAKAENTGAVSGDKSEQAEQSGTGDLNEKTAEAQYAELFSKGLAEAGKPDLEPEGKESAPEEKQGEAGEPAAKKEESEQAEEGEVFEGVSAKAQAKINERIHELNIKRKNAEAEVEQVKQQLSVLEKRVEGETFQAAMRMGVAPEYIEPEEAKTIQRYEKLVQWRAWCKQHRAGYEGEDGEVSAEDVAERRESIEEELLEVGPEARRIVKERAKQQREDMLAGRKLRLANLAKPPAAAEVKPIKLAPPKLPKTGASAANKPPVSAGQSVKAAFNAEEFEKDGESEDALEKQYQNMMAGLPER